jgi:hypothetical protein
VQCWGSHVLNHQGVPLGSLCTDVNKMAALAVQKGELAAGAQYWGRCSRQLDWLQVLPAVHGLDRANESAGVQSSCQRGRPHGQACRRLGGRIVEGTFTLNPD